VQKKPLFYCREIEGGDIQPGAGIPVQNGKTGFYKEQETVIQRDAAVHV
jgi:hypothetical protein